MNTIALLREQLRGAHEYLEETLADVTEDMAHWHPPGRATPIGANYVHLVQSEDAIISLLRQQAPIFQTMQPGEFGASESQPQPPWTEEYYFAWTRRVRVDLPRFRTYAQSVYAATDAYIAGLKPEDLDKEVNHPDAGMSGVTVAWVLSRYIIGHADNICGETSALKGAQGARGYAE
jgi:hypothetical protein